MMAASSVPHAWRARLDRETAPAILLSLGYEVLAANKAYRRLYGRESVGRRCHDVSHRYPSPCDEHGESCPLRECLSTKRAARALHVHHTPRGPEHVDVKLHPILGEDGDLQAFLEVMRKVESASTQAGGSELIGQAPAFNRMLGLLQRAAPSEIPVLLLGESGTGKELAARAVHRTSGRADCPFVPVACSGLSSSLFESELFGHERGAFTGASQQRIGLVESATGGTLFLDEIGDIALNMQVKLLRLLESRQFRRVGSNTPVEADFRLVCATHRDLDAMVAAGTFRQDLYFRINAFPVRMPALRERLGDLEMLTQHMLRGRARVHPDALEALRSYHFPGNVRELKNVMQRAELLADGEWIFAEHLPEHVVMPNLSAEPPKMAEIRPLREVEDAYLRWAERSHEGDRASLARLLGLSERTLYRKLKEARQAEE